MAEDNITVAVFSGGGRETTAAALWQYDYGQILQFAGIPELPVAYEVQFSNDREKGSAKTQIGGEDGVAIPDEFLVTGKPVFAWVFLHAGEEDGETVYQVTIPVRRRSRATDAPPTPQQQSAITEAIAALNAAVDAAETAQGAAEDAQEAAETAQGAAEDAKEAAETAQGKAEDAQEAAETAQGKAEDAQAAAETAAGHYPQIIDGYWYVWDVSAGEYVNTRVPATGGGATSYEDLANLPQIAGVTLIGNKSLAELGAGTYSKPASGIPKSDLASGVQGSLDKADAALPKTGGAMSGAIAMGSNKITGLAAGTADGDAVNVSQMASAISQSAAYFRGSFASRAALLAVSWQTSDPEAAYYVTNNDYAIVLDDETQSDECWRYIYVSGTGWTAQYRVNETPFTQAQLDALNSGATAANIGAIAGKYDASNPPPYPVTSVNEKTGAVELDASDVGALSTTGNAYRAVSIPMGALDNTSTNTAMTATVPGITELRDGVCMWLKNGVVTSAAGVTLDINNLGAKPIYGSNAAATETTTAFNINYTMLFVYNSTRVTGGCWDMVYGYDSNTTYTPPKLGFGYTTCSTAEATAAKTASLSNYALTTGGIVSVKFTNAVPANATLNIASKGAKAIYYKGAAITAGIIKAGDTATFVYSTYYHLISIDRQPSAADVGAIPAPASPSAGQELVYVGGAWVAADKFFVVTLTPTSLDLSGVMDKTPAEIYDAWAIGKTIVFSIPSLGAFVVATQFIDMGNSTVLVDANIIYGYQGIDWLIQIILSTSNSTYATYWHPIDPRPSIDYSQADDPLTLTLDPCPVTYSFGEKSEINVTVTATTQYHFSFTCPSGAATVLTMTGVTGIAGDTLAAGKSYEVDIWDGIALIMEVEAVSP